MNYGVTLNKLPYYGQNTLTQKQAIEKLANLSDDEIAQISAINAQEKSENSKAAKAQRALLPAVIGTVIASNVIRSGPKASAKIATGAAGIASFALLHKAFNIAGNAVDKITDKKNTDPQTKKDINCIGTIVGGAALFELGTTGLVKGIKYLKEKFPHSALELQDKIKKFDNFAANSKITAGFNKFVGNPIKKLTAKLPEGLKGALSKYTAPIAIGAFVVGSITLANKVYNNKVRAYNEGVKSLVSTREEAQIAADMLNKTEVNYDNAFTKEEFQADSKGVVEAADKNENIDEAVSKSLDEAVENIQE